jgi:colanic acid biosynthesis glycosyl transferase WcaI
MARILLHTLVFTPDGVSNAYLYRSLALELRRQGHRVTVLTTTPHYNVLPGADAEQPLRRRWGGLYRTSRVGDIPVIHIPMPGKSARAALRILAAVWFHVAAVPLALFAAGRHDVVLASSPPLTIGWIGKALALCWGGRSVYIVQDIFPDGLVRQGKIRSKPLIAALRRVERRVYDANDAVVVIADSFLRTLRPRLREPGRLRLIENFVDADFYRPLPRHNEFSRRHGLDDSFVVSYIGNIGNAQDLEPVLYAAGALRDLPIRFIVIGDGILRAKYEREAHLNHLDKVAFLGYLPFETTPWANAGSDLGLVLLSPHVQGAGFPSKIYSILACGRSALVTADEESDLRRIVRESGCGRVVPTGDPAAFAGEVRRAFEERDVLAAEGARGRAYIEERCSLPAVAAKYSRLIESLVPAAPMRSRS